MSTAYHDQEISTYMRCSSSRAAESRKSMSQDDICPQYYDLMKFQHQKLADVFLTDLMGRVRGWYSIMICQNQLP
jgi:hypothetical protein